MAARKIVSIMMWNEQSYLTDVVYADSGIDVLVGTRDMAAELAHDAGLAQVPTDDKTVVWASDGEEE
jgi:hypothetical protein